MEKGSLKELEAILCLMEQLDVVITSYKIQHGVAPIAYSYLYELCVLRLLTLFEGNPEFITGVTEATTKAVLMLLKLAQQSAPVDKELTDKLNKFKKLLEDTKIVIPDTVNEFLKKFPRGTCTPEPNVAQDPMDRIIDDYLKKKKEDRKRKRGKSDKS